MSRALIATGVLFAAACTVKETPAPSLMGPSEFGLSLTLEASPDLIVRDGVSRSTITVTARDAQGLPVRQRIWLEMLVNGVMQDFGSLSERDLTTGSDGKAIAFYTAPPKPLPGSPNVPDRITLVVKPVGTNQQGAKYTTTSAEIRLVLPIMTTPGAPVARFVASKTTAKIDEDIDFNGRESYVMPPATRIENYSWNWGDPSPVDSDNAESYENHNYATTGTFYVTLTVRDDLGREGSTTQPVTITP